MRNCDYGLPSPINTRLKTSIIIRPKSQNTRISLGQAQRSPKPLINSREELVRQSFQTNTIANQYYIQTGETNKRSTRQIPSSARKNSPILPEEGQTLDKLKKYISEKIQRRSSELRQHIYKQNAQIVQLEKTIRKMDRQIENKNSIIQVLIQKIQQKGSPQSQKVPIRNETLLFGKIKDLEEKMRIIAGQLEEEKQDVTDRLDKLLERTLKCLGSKQAKNRQALVCFMRVKEKQVQQLEAALQKSKEENQLNQELRHSGHSKDLKTSSGISVRDTCSSTSNSKQSLASERGNSKLKKDQSVFSDYFFHPSEPSEIDSPTVRAFQELVRQRQQLPIRAFIDGAGRLKYWQSRTFIFDRNGNFSTPSQGDVQAMERRGWLKMLGN